MYKYDIKSLKGDFPVFNQKINNNELVYLDSGATSQKPRIVLDAIKEYNEKFNGNPHRGAHYLSVIATEKYESSREKVKDFINSNSSREIIFTKNTTEAINLLAHSYGMNFIGEGDEIVISITEHHSNILPWQHIAKSKGATLKYMYVNNEGRLTMDEVRNKITNRTKLVAICHMSNVLGTIHPVKEIIEYAHEKGAVVLVDGAQSIPHLKVDVQQLDADFLVFSGHKMLGPMGIGVLYGKESLLEKMPPFLRGGDMIEYVWEQEATFAPLPFKFEGGTQNIEGAIGLAAAIDYINEIGIHNIEEHERQLTAYAIEKLLEIPYITIHGPKDTEMRGGVISFSIDGIHPHDVASIMDAYGIALRAGHHCAQPLMRYLEVPATSRISIYLYNDYGDIDKFIEGIKNVRKWFGHGS